MRGICKPTANNGDTRIVTKFIIIPRCDYNTREWRWLETVTMEQEYESSYANYDAWEEDKWKILRFID